MAKSHPAPPSTTSVDKADQKGRLLRIETVLSNDSTEKKAPGDPVLLTKVDGEEGFSIPYTYDIIMYRSTSKNKTNPITADMLIGTKALIHCRGDDENCEQMDLKLTRMGIFITFEQLESDKPEDYVKFGARLVPPFKLLDYESGFRVWEQISVIDIMKQALSTGTTIPIDTLDFGMIEEEQRDDPNAFPKLEYCVQFGETTFNFLSRLMKEYGIWYYFGSVNKGDGEKATADNELMRFGRKRMDQFANVKSQHIAQMRISKEPPAFDVDLPTFDFGGNKGWTVSSWRRTFIPAPFIQYDGGNFNQMDPSSPIDASDKIKPQRDLFTQKSLQAYDRARVIRQVFPTPAELNDHKVAEGVGKKYEAENQYVDTRIDEGTCKTSLVSGISKNPTFAPGLVFTTDADLTDRGEANKAFTLTRVQFSAFDLDYDFLTAGMLLEDVWDKTLSQLKGTDGSTSAVSQGLSDFMSNLTDQQTSSSGQGQNIFNAPDAGTGFNDVAGALTGALTSALVNTAGAFGSNLLKDLFADRSGYANNFVCIDPEEGTAVLPIPGGTKPKVHGPHLALVIGPDENDELSTKKMDVYGDKFGRVRVRFPWDKENFLLRPDSLAPTRPAAWVRVSEGWAGRQWGHQFMPRIGQEVIVDFIDGDPDRPIITGRVYNSDHGPINQPFPANQRTDEVLKLDDWLEPKEAQHRYAGIKTSSIPVVKGDGTSLPVGFHLLRFDDTRGKEQYLVRSQRRLDITALQKRYESISSDRHLTVGGKKITPPPKEIGGDYIAKVFRHYHLHVGDPEFPTQSGTRNTLLEQDEKLQAKGNLGQFVGGNWSVTLGGGLVPVGGQATIDVPGPLGTIVLNAQFNITLSVGATSIVITPMGVSITAPTIQLVGPVFGPSPMMIPGAAPFPPMPPIDAGPVTPMEPTPADPGDTLTPPKE